MQEQWSRLGRAVGNIFYPVLEKVLPYVNAILMVLVEIAKLVANLLGFKMPEFDYSGLSNASDATSDIVDGMDEATKSAEKLKTGLRGFDKLNNISVSSGDSSPSSGVDPAIMSAFNDSFSKYNDMMDEVRMKATKIRDKILDWLGFTDGTYKNLKLIGGVLATILGFKLIKGIAGLITGTSRLSKLLGTGGLYSAIAKIGTAISGMLTAIATALGISVGWLVLIGVAIVGLIATIIIFKDEIANFFVSMWDSVYNNFVLPITEFIMGIADFVYKNAIKPILDFFEPIFNAIVDIFTLIVKNVADIIIGIGKAIISIISKFIEMGLKIAEIFLTLGIAFYNNVIKPIINKVGEVASAFYNKIISPVLGYFGNIAQGFYDKVILPMVDKLTWLKNKAVGIFKTIGTTVVEFISRSFKSVINGILSSFESTINGFIKMLNGSIKMINKLPGVPDIKPLKELDVPRLKTGMDFVPKDFYGPVYLDYGERVLTKDENANYNKNSTSGVTSSGLNSQSTSGIQNATFIIKVGTEEIGKMVLKDLNKMAKSNGEPIVIGG